MMLIAATRAIRSALPGAIVAVAPDSTHPFQLRAEQGLWHRAELTIAGRNLGSAIAVVPRRLRLRYGFVTESEIDIVIDAAGFAYSEHWGPAAILDLARRFVSWRAKGKKLILLPQAFGPFRPGRLQDAVKRIIESAHLVFARDQVSYGHLVEIAGEHPSIRQAPDFTNLLSGTDPGALAPCFEKPVAIIPNYRMIEKTSTTESAAYVDGMLHCAVQLKEKGMDPFLLIHEGRRDRELGDEINRRLAKPLTLLWPDDPLVAKGIIQRCTGVIASRYHALVSALSLGVPALGTCWSHKYSELFNDYNCSECLMHTLRSRGELDRAVALISSDSKRSELKTMLTRRSEVLKRDASLMWRQVFDVIA